LHAQFVETLQQSPIQLANYLLFLTGGLPKGGKAVVNAGCYAVREVEKCTGVQSLQPALQFLQNPQLKGASPAQMPRLLSAQDEPLDQFLTKHQQKEWLGAREGAYRPQEEARHAQRLKAYVQAAGRRAAQQAPAVASVLQEMLELGDSNK
jgi:hypothetical protein